MIWPRCLGDEDVGGCIGRALTDEPDDVEHIKGPDHAEYDRGDESGLEEGKGDEAEALPAAGAAGHPPRQLWKRRGGGMTPAGAFPRSHTLQA